jgi:2-iminobutanoate/2-iminopropanoate deaminase
MKLITHNPSQGIYAATPDYVHAIEVQHPQRILFVAGTMGLDEHGTAPPSLDRQLELIWSNIGAILASAGMSFDNIVRLTSYLRDVSFVDANGAARVRALGDRRIPTTAIVVQTLSPDWLVEIEVIAVA